MDDTTTAATPSSTAASAAAVADTKDNSTHEPEGGNLCSPNKTNQANNTNNVELVIKSSNQQYDDIVINSDLQWSVKHLKQQLSLVYPGKPLIEDQKLIYSGKLLKDKEQLFEIIRNYKDVFTQNHVVHLVCAAKNLPMPGPKTKTTITAGTKTRTTGGNINNTANHNAMNTNVASAATADGLRQRQSGGGGGVSGSGGVSVVDAHQQRQMPAVMQHQQQWQTFLNQAFQRAMTRPENNTNASVGSIPTTTTGINYGQQNLQWQQAMAAHQSVMYNAWMQQVYAQYMHQALQGNSNAAGNHAGAAAIMSANPLMQQQLYFMNTYFGVNPAAVADAPVFPSFAETVPGIPPQQGPLQEPANVEGAQVARDAVQLPRRQARQFPNIQEEPEHRDWLDNFFAIIRMAIFITILYFNSSPMRCILVILIASSIYLYHVGVLRRRERNNNNLNRNNNANNAVADEVAAQVQRIMDGNEGAQAQPVAEEQQQQQQQEQQGQVIPPNRLPQVPAGLADAADVAEPADAVAAVEPANSASLTSIVRTFVITFFTSLLPEAPAV